MSQAKGLHVLVVAFNAADLLDASLSKLEQRFPVTVIDNSSSRAVQSVVEDHGARYVDALGNRGFAAGVNMGLRLLDSPTDVLLLNPDAEIGPDRVLELVAELNAHERVAAISPMIVDPDGTAQRVMWPWPSPWRALAEAAGLTRLFREPDDYAIGAVLLLKWDAVQAVGQFDERYFLYAEETDWQRRALELGWVSRLSSRATAVHVGAGTSGDALRREALFLAGGETYIRKWYGSLGWQTYRVAMALGALARSAVLRGERRGAAWRRFRIMVAGPRRSAGLA